jgi:hypothetical protein
MESQGPGGCALQAAPRNFRACKGAVHPPRKAAGGKLRRTAGGLHFLWGGAEMRRSRLWSLKLVLDALRVHARSLVQTTAFPGRACSRKGGSSGGAQGRQPAPGEPQGPQGWNSRVHSGTAGGRGGLK